jgi:hypothetical protein
LALERRARPMLFRVYPTTKARSPQMRLWEPQSGQEMRRLQMQTLARPQKSRVRNQRPARPKNGPEVQDEQLKLVAELLIHPEDEAMQTGSGSGSFSSSGSESLHI